MQRRDFLKLVGAAVAGVGMPKSVSVPRASLHYYHGWEYSIRREKMRLDMLCMFEMNDKWDSDALGWTVFAQKYENGENYWDEFQTTSIRLIKPRLDCVSAYHRTLVKW